MLELSPELLALLCLAPPVLASLLAWLGRAFKPLPPATALSASSISAVASLLMFSSYRWPPLELQALPLWSPGLPLCLLLDPLSTFMAIVVSSVGALIMAYSVSYMRGEPGQERFWSLMSLFLASMLLLVLAGDLVTLLVGWKLVGFCSYALISHYYTDERERWVGGPPPEPMYPPSHCGLKALMTVFVGDVMMFSAVFIIYAHAGTFDLLALYSTAEAWLTSLARTPGMLALTCVLLMGGPLSKSAQIPFSEWLPEAMAGPTPVSALIHAATMVKAGVFVVARFMPAFYTGLWGSGLSEAACFFLIPAYLGAITAFLAAAQACVASELKKALAYSTMSQLGYLMLGLGAAGLTPEPAPGAAATFYHLASHALFKSALFMMAGIAIHAFGSIYMEEMGGLRHHARATWMLTLLAASSLVGIPPLSGFWGKEAIISTSLQAGLWAPFSLALLAVPLTAFYTIRLVGMVFHGRQREHVGEHRASWGLVGPLGFLALASLIIGLLAPPLMELLEEDLSVALATYTGSPEAHAQASLSSWPIEHLPSMIASLLLMALMGFVAYALYVKRSPSPEELLAASPLLRSLRKLLRARLGLNSLYYALSSVLLNSRPKVRRLEGGLDGALNRGVPRVARAFSSIVRKLQTGYLGYNMAYLAVLLVLLVLLVVLGVI
ncbi:hypothetical protein DRO60_04600 [Candidatus Bathyarchaeota archaeon]|nr:MAG: hypothetical protein DRO60_04600 [Candidatus Bathyarchaeota archaeon]